MMPSSRLVRYSIIALALLAVLPVLRFSAQKLSKAIESDPQISPPSLQIQRQAVQVVDDVLPDAELGYVLPPNLDQTIESIDFTSKRTTDSRGFPNPGPWPAQADMVFLGDSLLVGAGVGVSNGFVALLDAALEDRTILNLGNPGAGPERQLRIFQRYGVEVAPQLVVACLYLASDIEGDQQFRAWLADAQGMEYNRFRLSFARRQQARSGPDLMRHFEYNPLFLWLQSVVEPRLWGDSRFAHRLKMPDGNELFFGRDKVRFARQAYSGDEKIFLEFLAPLERLRELAATYGTTLAVVLIPSKEELFAVDPGSQSSGAAAIVRSQLRKLDIPVLDLYPILVERAAETTPYFTSDIHLNSYGNQVVADALLQWQEIRNLPTGSQSAVADIP
ncbi:MAG: hypothetical protein IPI75_00020 [Gammaproteobacteria bacterium]|nr:hypothetical protein [Gammaproteobacteria bacterium]